MCEGGCTTGVRGGSDRCSFFLCFESVCILECKLVAKIGCINGIVMLCGEKHSDLAGVQEVAPANVSTLV